MNADAEERTVTLAEAASLAHVSKATIRSRVARGTLRTVLRDGMRRVSIAELERAGLIEPGAAEDVGEPAAPLTTDELLDRLERQAERIGQLEVENARLERELQAERVLRQEAERRAG